MSNSQLDRRRTGIWNRRQNREQRLHVLRSNRSSFLGVTLIGGTAVAGVAFLIPWQFARGLFVGFGVSAIVAMIAYFVLAVSGTVARGMGATAEMWTASELRRLRRHGWLIVNGLPLENHDIDHVLVGPGGVVVVESNWSASGWDLTKPDHELAKIVDQVVANARSLRLWRAVKASGAPVRSVIVLWGGNRAGSAERPHEPIKLGDTTVVYGLTAVRRWMNDIVRDTLHVEPTIAEALWQELNLLIEQREERDHSATPPTSVDRAVWTVTATAIAFASTLLVCLETFAQTGSWWLLLTTIATLLCVCLLIRRLPIARVVAAGGIAGLAAASTLAGLSAAVALVNL